MIEGQHGAEDEETRIVAGAGDSLHCRIEPAGRSIAEITHAASGHGRNVLSSGQFAMCKFAAQYIDGCAGFRALSMRVLHGGDSISAAHYHGGVGAEE